METYTATWERLALLAWSGGTRRPREATRGEREFWEHGILRLADRRVRRRRVVYKPSRSPLEQRIPMQLRKKTARHAEPGEVIQVARILIELQAGPAILLLPENLTQAGYPRRHRCGVAARRGDGQAPGLTNNCLHITPRPPIGSCGSGSAAAEGTGGQCPDRSAVPAAVTPAA